MRNLTADNSAWADFLISKAALVLASIILFAALFNLVANFKDLETQKQLDSLAWDFKNKVDDIGAVNFQERVTNGSSQEFKEIPYCFNEKELFRTFPLKKDLKIRVSGEYVSLETESEGRNFNAVRPFTFRILPFNESVLYEKLHARFGTDGSALSPLTVDYAEIETFIRMLGTAEAVMDPEVNISMKKELVYIKKEEEVSAFACILIYQ